MGSDGDMVITGEGLALPAWGFQSGGSPSFLLRGIVLSTGPWKA